MTQPTTTCEMVERVAKAIPAANGETLSDTNIATMFRRDARAAIAAMREPSPAMEEALVDAVGRLTIHPDYSGESQRVWHVMIDAALQDDAA